MCSSHVNCLANPVSKSLNAKPSKTDAKHKITTSSQALESIPRCSLGHVHMALPRFGGDVRHDGAQRLIRGLDVVDGALELREQEVDLLPLPAHLVEERNIARLRRLQPRVELGLVRGEGGGSVGGEDGGGGEEVRPGLVR